MPEQRAVGVRLTADISDFNRKMLQASAGAKAFTNSLDTSTDRMQNLVQTGLALGPALVPISAAAVPAISGLTNQLAFAAVGAGVTALAFQGVGDALKATNEYAIEPSTANFEKMQDALRSLSPAAREFVGFLQQARPEIEQLQAAAAQGLFPGAEAGLTDLMTRLPQAERIVSTVASTLGDLIAEAGDNLADPRWSEFFTFLETEARPTLIDMGRTFGNLAEGFANLWMAFDPLSDDFSASFLQMSRDFAAWSDGLSETQGFQEFVDYIRENGPEAWETLGALGNALLELVEAAAPVGSALLPVIKVMADTLATLADSDLGPIVIGVVSLTSAYARLIALSKVANSSAIGGLFNKSAYAGTAAAARQLPAALLAVESASERANTKAGQLSATSTRLGTSIRGAAKVAGGAGGLAFVMSDLDDKMGLANTAALALAGSMFGPWGAAIGAGVGAARDLQAANEGLANALKAANAAIDTGNLEALTAAQKNLNKELSNDDGTGQKVIDTSEKFKSLFNVIGAAGPAIIDKYTTSTDEASSVTGRLGGALSDAQAKAQEQKFQQAGLSGALDGASQSTRDQTEALLDNIAAHNVLADEILKTADAELAYEQAIDDATRAAKQNGKNTDITTQKGRDNKEALINLAGAWNALTPAQQNAAGSSKRARAEFVAVAQQMGYNSERAARLADKYLDIPTKVSTRITTPGLGAASANLGTLMGQLARLDKTSVSAVVNLSVRGANLGAVIGQLNTINRKKASGGLIVGPGGPRDDIIPALLSNGEFVVNAAATRKNYALLHAINAQQFADGGVAQPADVQPMAPVGAYTAASSASPVYAIAPGAKFRLVGADLIELVDNRVAAGVAGSSRHTASAARRRGKSN